MSSTHVRTIIFPYISPDKNTKKKKILTSTGIWVKHVNLGLTLVEILTMTKFMEEQPSGTFGDKKIWFKSYKWGLDRRVVFHVRGHSIRKSLCILTFFKKEIHTIIAELNFVPFKMNMRLYEYENYYATSFLHSACSGHQYKCSHKLCEI